MISIPTGRALLDADAVLEIAGLSEGEHYADFGAGSLGHFALPASAKVGRDGRVYAVDVLQTALAALKSRASAEGANNLIPVWGDFEHPRGVAGIPQHSINLVALVNVTGALLRSPQVASNIVRLLKPGGRVLLVDWNKLAEPIGPPLDQRHAPEEVEAVLLPLGFSAAPAFVAGPHHWGLLFKK